MMICSIDFGKAVRYRHEVLLVMNQITVIVIADFDFDVNLDGKKKSFRCK